MLFPRSMAAVVIVVVLFAGPSSAAPRRAAPPMAPAAQAPTSAPTPAAPGPEPGPDALGLLAVAAGLAAAFAGAAWALRRWPLTARWLGRAGAVQVVARAAVGPRHTLCLVETLGIGILLALHPQGLSVVHVWPDGPPDTTTPGTAALPAVRTAASTPRQLASLVEAVRRRRGSP
jgi:flagellar biogenesis protein FliO